MSRRKDVSAALLDPKTFSSRTTPIPILLFADPPDHAPMRALVAPRFTPAAISGLADQIAAISDKMVDACLDKGRFDAIDDFAGPLTIFMMSRLLGISVEEVEDVRALSQRLAEYVLAVRMGQTPSEAAASASADMTRFFLRLADSGGHDEQAVLAVLIDRYRSGAMPAETMVQFATLLFVAGHSTTTNLLGNALYSLARHPAHLDRMRDEPGFVEPFIEEVLRTRPSFQRLQRVTTRDVTLHGETIPAGSLVMLLLGSANRDPASFEEPESFDASKSRRAHLSFGQGVHSCLGSWLARLESRIALTMIAERAASVTLDPDQAPTPLTGGTFNEFGFERLPVILTRC